MPTNESGQQDQQQQTGQNQPDQQTQSSTQTQNGDQGQQNQAQGQQQQQQQQQAQGERNVPYRRFQEVNTGYQTEKQRADQLATQLEQATRKIQALAGFQSKAPEELEMEEVRQALFKVHPALAKLSDEMIDKLVKVAESGDQIEETNKTIWRNHGNKMISNAQREVADMLGVEKLTERQMKRVSREYVSYIEENSYLDDNGRPAGAILRHEAGDDNLMQEFAKEFLADWQESIRKSVVTNETQGSRRPVPSGRGRSVIVGRQKPKIDFSDNKAFGDALVQSFQDHGGSFGEK